MADADFSPASRRHAHALAALTLALSHPKPDQDLTPDIHESLARLAEGQLDATQRRQLFALLDTHPALYQQWINLQILLDPNGQAEHLRPESGAQPASTAPLGQRIRAWLSAHLTGGLSLASAFGLVLGLGLGQTRMDEQEQAQLVQAQPAREAAAKASVEHVAFGQVEAGIAHTLPANGFLCSANTQWSGALCVTRTRGQQHWLTLGKSGSITALIAPIKADRIDELSFSPDGKYSAVLSLREGKRVLTLIAWHDDIQLDEPRLFIVETTDQPISAVRWQNNELLYQVGSAPSESKSVSVDVF